MNIAAVVLAAGGSKRLGSPKQLLRYGGASLLRHAAVAAMIACHPVAVVLGSRADDLENELHGLSVLALKNPAWGKGMGTSVRMGVESLHTLAPDIDGVLLTLCDQPLVGPGVLGQLCDAFERAGSTRTIVAASYNRTRGVPAIFGRAHFDELLALPDDAGAKSVLMKHHASVIEVPLPEAAVDIDTREQYERFMAAINNARDGN